MKDKQTLPEREELSLRQEQAEASEKAAAEAGTEPQTAEAAPGLRAEQTEQKEDFQALIRGRYREDYLKALTAALRDQAVRADRYLAYRELCFAAERLKRDRPGFDLMRELENPAFARLVENGVDPETAYEAVRREQTRRDDQVRARNAARPEENGLGRNAAAAFLPDPRSLTAEQRRSLRRRAARGEQIVW